MEAFLETVAKWSKRCGLDDFQTATAQSLAWYRRTLYDGPELPDGHWAREVVRAVLNGRDLPDCAVSQRDALSHCVQGAGMSKMMDRSPTPDVLVEHAELMERILDSFTEVKREVVDLKCKGVKGNEIAAQLGLSNGRVSQICREVMERFCE